MINETAARRIAEAAENTIAFGEICGSLQTRKTIEKHLGKAKLSLYSLASDVADLEGFGHVKPDTLERAAELLIVNALAYAYPSSSGLVNNPNRNRK